MKRWRAALLCLCPSLCLSLFAPACLAQEVITFDHAQATLRPEGLPAREGDVDLTPVSYTHLTLPTILRV